MKKIILLKILERLRSDPNFKRKLKIFAIVGVIGFVITTGLAIWASVALIRFAGHQIQALNVNAPTTVEAIESQWQSFPAITTASCLNKMQSLMNLQSWLTTPIADNFRNLKVSCLEAKLPSCEGDVCVEKEMKLNPKEPEQVI